MSYHGRVFAVAALDGEDACFGEESLDVPEDIFQGSIATAVVVGTAGSRIGDGIIPRHGYLQHRGCIRQTCVFVVVVAVVVMAARGR